MTDLQVRPGTEALPTTTISVDGRDIDFTPGETVYEVCRRAERDVTTLCYDERLEPFGACRLCVVEIEQNSRVALAFSERVVVMDKGRIVYDGPSARLRADPAYLASLIAAE